MFGFGREEKKKNLPWVINLNKKYNFSIGRLAEPLQYEPSNQMRLKVFPRDIYQDDDEGLNQEKLNSTIQLLLNYEEVVPFARGEFSPNQELYLIAPSNIQDYPTKLLHTPFGYAFAMYLKDRKVDMTIQELQKEQIEDVEKAAKLVPGGTIKTQALSVLQDTTEKMIAGLSRERRVEDMGTQNKDKKEE